MGYFANGTEGDMYEEEYCENCVHYGEIGDCAVLHAHALYNYDECNNPKSILHILIPRKNGQNQKCTMFIDQKEWKREKQEMWNDLCKHLEDVEEDITDLEELKHKWGIE